MLMTLIAAASISSGVLSYEEAKRRADLDEAALQPKQSAVLVESQGAVVGPAFTFCLPSPPPTILPSFTIVLSLDASGAPQETWLQGDAEFAKCVRERFAAAKFFKPPKAPFYTSFEFTFKP